jgi:thioredoxin-like negative regulator of GroEL
MLEEMLAAEPGDPFLRYGLALELAQEGEQAEAVRRLRALIADKPDYVPAYFQAAQLLYKAGDMSAAAELLRTGIANARAQSNQHAAEEMSAMLAQIE